MKKIILIPCLLSIGLFSCTAKQKEPKKNLRPNILLIVADDLGYADLGAYGGDIETPTIDSLSRAGIRFSRFHTAPLCSPTRAMLLTGNDNHVAGIGRQSLSTSEWGYEGRISERVPIMPEVLKKSGYHTYMAGKWHLGTDAAANPKSRGFERSFINLLGAGNHYNDQGLFAGDPTTPYTEDGKPASWPNGTYSTEFYTDKIIEYIDANIKDGKPFFAFGAYTSPHWPLQVDEKYSKKYKGRYDEGYEVLKARRLASLKAAGLIPENAVLPPNHSWVKPWDDLSEDEQRKEAKKMELYAGMVDNLDVNIGRILNYLRSKGQLENTLVVFMSDNGAAAEDFYYDDDYGPFLKANFSDAEKDMGLPHSFISYGPQWAEAGSSPLRYFKGQPTEGGNTAPMIMAGAGVKVQNKTNHEFVTLLDMAPSFYEIAGAKYPVDNVYPLKGNSFTSLFQNSAAAIHDTTYVFAMEHGQRAFVRKGDWKLVNNNPPFNEENFELYNVKNDLAELQNQRNSHPSKYEELLIDWRKYVVEMKIQFPTPSPD